jgi:NADPH:quinone reductase-like Zn-dependent oxidoreductase
MVIDRVSPLPIVLAQRAINDAEALRDKDKEAAQRLLAVARNELDRAKELGYASNDPEYAALTLHTSAMPRSLSRVGARVSAGSGWTRGDIMHDNLKTMRAAAFERFGGPEALTTLRLPVPDHDKNEVVIMLDTMGVGPWDAEIREGWYPGGRPRFPLVLGTDGAGAVAAVGSRVSRFKQGDLVYSYSFDNPFGKGGFYAEYVVVVEEKVAHIPGSLDLVQAGAIPTTGLTALQGIDDALHVKSGETVIIHGASGGVGTLAVQFAKLRGARVLATASGKDGIDLALRLGADEAVDGRGDGIKAVAPRFAPDGIDAVLGLAGGDGLERCIDTLRRGGLCAYPNGVEPEPRKRHGIEIVSYDAIAGIHQFEHLGSAIEAANLQVIIADAYEIADAAKAHERLAAGHVFGKIVLQAR